MLTSLALIFLLGMFFGSIFAKLRLPALLGMLITGILLGPYVLNLIDDAILTISADLRQLALVIILMRAGLSLNINDLKRVGRPALLMCFVPACFEIIGMVLLAPKLIGVTILDAAIIGSIIAAVSPAVIVPRMLFLMETGWGTDKSIPQLIMAGASVDDVFVIVLFTSFTSIAQGQEVSLFRFAGIPVSIILGIAAGVVLGILFTVFFKKVHIRDSAKVLILLSASFLLLALEKKLEALLPFSGLIAIMALGAVLLQKYAVLANRLSAKFSKLWTAAEILLFVLVGAAVNIQYAFAFGIKVILLLLFVLFFRIAGVFLCLLKTDLNKKERLFCMAAYSPKATVQAAIGGIPLSMGLACGNIALTMAVIAIMLTAPLGAFAVDLLYKRCLQQRKA